MLKLEQAMNAAIKLGRDLTLNNTRVAVNGDTAWVYLHSNHIATVNRLTGEVEVNLNTLLRWPTTTTKSRLRALGVNVATKAGKIYLNDEVINNGK